MNIAVFCGSSTGHDPRHSSSAREFGAMLAARGHGLVFGGGRVGLMGVVADAVLAGGGRALGVIPGFLEKREVAHRGLTELVVTESMHLRKQRMSEEADAFVILGGGFGTLDELFEILTWKQIGLHDKPIVIVDVAGAWKPLRALVDGLVSQGFVRDEHRALFTIVDSAPAAVEACETAPRVRGSIESKLT